MLVIMLVMLEWGADLFGSYEATVLAAMVLGNYLMDMGGTELMNF